MVRASSSRKALKHLFFLLPSSLGTYAVNFNHTDFNLTAYNYEMVHVGSKTKRELARQVMYYPCLGQRPEIAIVRQLFDSMDQLNSICLLLFLMIANAGSRRQDAQEDVLCTRVCLCTNH